MSQLSNHSVPEKIADYTNDEFLAKICENSEAFIIKQEQYEPIKSVKLVSLAQIAANNTKQYTPFRVTVDGLKFSLLSNFFSSENNRVVFFCGLTFWYGGSYLFEKDYKSADCQLNLLNISNPSIAKYRSEPSYFTEGEQIKIREYIDIWNAEIFEELTEDDMDVQTEMLKSKHKKHSMY